MKKLMVITLLALGCFVLAQQARAESVVRQLPFSKKVSLAVPKTYLFKFELCNDALCGSVGYIETQQIALKTTTLSFNLGAGTVDPTSPTFDEVDFSQQYWLRVSRSTATGFTAIGAPTKLTVVPYALWSNQVEGVGAGVGTITGVYGGNGLTGSGTSGAVTLNVGAGSGIEVGGDAVSIASGGVTSAHIQDGAVTSADIQDGAVTSADIQDGAVTSADIQDGAVNTADIANGAVTSAKIATGGVTGTNILDGTVSSADITDLGVLPADVAFNYAGSLTKGGSASLADNSDLVDGRHAIALRPVLAFSSTAASTLINATCTNYSGGSVSIYAPAAGTIVVEFDLWVRMTHQVLTRDFAYFMVGTTSSDCSSPAVYCGIIDLPTTDASNFIDRSVHVTRPFSVGLGSHTFYLNGYMASGAGNDNFYFANMKAVFYPN